MKTRSLRLTPVLDLAEHLAGFELVAFNSDPDGAVSLVLAGPPLQLRQTGPGGASFAVTQPERSPTYRVLTIRDGFLARDITVTGEPFNIHQVQVYGDELLLVCSRCHYSASGEHERNGRRYSLDGTFVGDMVLGDGIQDIQATSSGTLWVSYFDEGIFGNFGWNEPLGGPGLVAWKHDGTRLTNFEPSAGLDHICDCYALNVVSDDDVWLCYYTDFPLVQLRGGQVERHWAAPVQGSSAFAIGSGHCLFQGGYDQRDTYVLAELGSSPTPRSIHSFVLVDDLGQTLKATRTTARSDKLFLMVGSRLFQVDINLSFAAS